MYSSRFRPGSWRAWTRSLKFTPPGGSVAVSVTRDAAAVNLAVRDSGVGIPSDALPYLFDRFYRVDSARSPSQDGAGLGLSLVKWIAERHGGTIDATTRPGEGSTFTVSLLLLNPFDERAADSS